MSAVLIAGLPRSGTTWVGRVLGLTEGARYVHEPDNHRARPEAWWAKRDLGSYPRLVPGQHASDYEALFETAFAGGCRPSLRYASARAMHRAVSRAGLRNLAGAPLRLAGHRGAPGPAEGNVVVKSVFCARSVEWLAGRFRPAVVVMTRHPFSVIASWQALGWDGFLDREPDAVAHCAEVFGVAPPRRGAAWIDRAAWHYGYLSTLLGQAAGRHPGWVVVNHEELCADPHEEFGALCRAVRLRWTDEAEEFLTASNRAGRGYSTNRVWSREVDGWRTKLAPEDGDRVWSMLAQFRPADPLAGARRPLLRCGR